jgi:DNA-binding MltR family transcriptional regulator
MQSEKKRTLRTLREDEPSKEEWEVIGKEITSTSDRSAAILLAANVENAVAKLIAENLTRNSSQVLESLYARDGALSSFFSVINLGYAMGLYDDKIRDDLDTIRRIRNSFAHARRPINFATIEISDECKKIKTINDSSHPVSKTYFLKRHPIEKRNSDARKIYLNTGLAISVYLSLRLARRFAAKARNARRKMERLQQQRNEMESVRTRMRVLDVMMSEQERNEIMDKVSLTMSWSDFDAINVQLEALALKYGAKLPPRFSSST